jgi:predicted signal transduction protein with EAL and GGDEF domain
MTADGRDRFPLERLRFLLDNAAWASYVVTGDGRIMYASGAGLHGDDPGSIVGASLIDLVHPADRARARAILAAVVGVAGRHEEVTVRLVGPDGDAFWVELRMTNALDVPEVAGVAVSCSGRRPLATRDPVTGLAMGGALSERLQQVVRGDGGTLVLLHVGNLVPADGRVGRDNADAVLRAMARRLADAAAPDDTVARLTSNRFGVLRPGCVEPTEAVRLARRLVAVTSRPVVVDRLGWPVSISAGVAVVAHGEAEDSFHEAELALGAARNRGRGSIELFDERHARSAALQRQLAADLLAPSVVSQLRLVYQPIVDLGSGVPLAFEALLRWRHPTHGDIAPDAFIPLAEQTGAIHHIGRWALRTACHHAASMPAGPTGPISVSVNVSARQLTSDRLVDDVLLATSLSDLAPRRLILEITETAVVDDPTAAERNLRTLAGCGVRIAVDDFGTGHSTLAYLRQLPVDVIKIDRTFVEGVGEDSQDTAIVSGVIAMARALGTLAIAEGVETVAQRDRLVELGCTHGQGWLYAQPIEQRHVRTYLTSGTNGQTSDTSTRTERSRPDPPTGRRRRNESS